MSRLRPRLSAPERAVLVSGVASIGLEILAGRVVTPAFGSSVYTWGSSIGVNLGALGLGYHLGGRRAADRASREELAVLMFGAAAYVGVVVGADGAVLAAADGLALPARFAPLLPVAVLFGPPVFLLGFVSPYAAELSRVESTGGASGRVYALGTLGSLLGAFGTTFALLPAADVPTLELGFGLLLVAGALACLGREVRPEHVGHLLVVSLVLTGGFVASGPDVRVPGDDVYTAQTQYQRLTVADSGGVRTLYLDGTPQSATYLDDREGYVYDYSKYLHVPLLLQDDVDRVLFVGGGGFSTPKRYLREYPNVTVDVVELDPAVVDAARTYFGVPDSPRLHVHVADGREFLEETDHTYDAVVLDAFRADRVPEHLLTVEFARLVADRLDADGTLVTNLISAPTGPASRLFRAVYATQRRAFPHVYAFPTGDPNATSLQNVELVATKRPGGFTEAALVARARERDVGVPLVAAMRDYLGPADVPTDDVPVLRDERGSVNALLDPQLDREYVLGANATTQASASIATPVDVPIRSAPASRSARAASASRTPPAAFTGA